MRPLLRPQKQRSRSRRGISLMEVMVVIAIALALIIVAVPAISQILKLGQAKAAKRLAISYRVLHDDAVLKNTTYRIAYHLDAGYYVIEEGSPDALIYATAEEREEAEKQAEEADKIDETLRSMYQNERTKGDFSQMGATFSTKVDLPSDMVFGGVYTPQYEELVKPGDLDNEKKPIVVYSYIFGSGFAEHTIIQLVDADDPDEGYTIQVEPLSGAVKLHTEVIDPRDAFDFVPDEGPSLSE